jgi:hypothetical protein
MPKRIQIDITEKSFARLCELKQKTDSSSYGDVTQKAYKVLEYFQNAKDAGKTIQVISADGSITEIELV